MADLTLEGNPTSGYPPHRQFLELASEGRYRLRGAWIDSDLESEGAADERATIAMLTDRQCAVRAIAQFEGMGRDEFLAKHGFGRARTWFVTHDGRLYDSKAIAGVALSTQYNRPVAAASFMGDEHFF